MKKLVAFVGSPRKNGNVSTIVNKIVQGAKDSNIQCKIYYLNDLNIRGCQGCLYCRTNSECCLKDDMKEIYESLKEADYMVIGSPVYICQVSAQTKLLLDRLYPFTEIDKGRHIPRFGNRKLITVYSQAAPIPFIFRWYFRYTEKHLKGMGIERYKTLLIWKAFTKDAASKNEKILNKAYTLGKNLS